MEMRMEGGEKSNYILIFKKLQKLKITKKFQPELLTHYENWKHGKCHLMELVYVTANSSYQGSADMRSL